MTRPAVIPKQIDLEHLQPSDRHGAYAVIRNVLPLFMLSALAPLLAARSIAAAWALAHHRMYGRAEDPQGFHYLGVQRLSRVQFAWHLVKPLFGANLRYVLRESMLHPGNSWRAVRRGDAVVFLSVQLLMFIVVTGGGRYFHLALLPFVSAATFGLFLSQLRGLAEHGSRSAVDQAGVVRSHSARLLERLVLYDLHFNYHSAHHRWPQCPSRHLPLVHERYLAGHVPLEPSMLATVVAIHAGDRSCGRRCGSDARRRGGVRSALESDATAKGVCEADTDAGNESGRGPGVQRVCSRAVQVEQMARAVVASHALPSRGSIRFGRTVR